MNILGMTSRYIYKVEAKDLANNWRNDAPVVATPILLWISELACMQITTNGLLPNQMTVGYHHEAYHIDVAFESNELLVMSKLLTIQGNTLEFDVSIFCGIRKIFYGKHSRKVINKDNFSNRIKKILEA